MKSYFNLSNSLLKQFALICILLVGTMSFGCKKWIEVDAPPTSINGKNVYSIDNTAIQMVTGLLTRTSINNYDPNAATSLYYLGGLMSDELTLFNTADGVSRFYRNSLTANNGMDWSAYYVLIAQANDAIEGLSASSSLSPQIKQQLLGEAKFIRAFNLFYLVNLYGDVPMPLTTNYEINRLLARSKVSDVYAQIIIDLTDSKKLLSINFLDGTLTNTTLERVRPTKSAATALLARTYLYMGDYDKAEAQASELIANSKFNLAALNEVFLKNSSETIWSLQPVRNDSNNGYNTGEGRIFNLTTAGPTVSRPVYLSESLINSFEPGDLRKNVWINSVKTASNQIFFFPFKYKASVTQSVVVEYSVVFRLAEQFLIRAEARAHLKNYKDALADLNVLRNRAKAAVTVSVPNPLPDFQMPMSESQIFQAIEHERQVELFSEGGHRWFDLIRITGFNNSNVKRADEVMPAVTQRKGGVWKPNQKLCPIQQNEIQLNPNLIQNNGY